MNLLRNNKLQKLSTTFMLALLLFINAIKVFHTHDFSNSAGIEKLNKNAKIIKAAFSCSICDFQIAKDCDAATTTLQLQPDQQSIHCFYHYVLPAYNSIIATSSGTDPPIAA